MPSSPPETIARSPTTHVQSLIIQLDGITAADYLTWVWDPEPPAFDHGLRSVAICAEPRGELIKLELVWAGRRPATPSAAAVAAGFALIPEVVAVLAGTAPTPGTPAGLKAKCPDSEHTSVRRAG
jgi:hypothetical protein